MGVAFTQCKHEKLNMRGGGGGDIQSFSFILNFRRLRKGVLLILTNRPKFLMAKLPKKTCKSHTENQSQLKGQTQDFPLLSLQSPQDFSQVHSYISALLDLCCCGQPPSLRFPLLTSAKNQKALGRVCLELSAIHPPLWSQAHLLPAHLETPNQEQQTAYGII